MTIIPAVIAWAFTVTFLVALALILLDVAGLRQIRDQEHRRWLFRTLFVSVVVAVLGYGTWQFDLLKREPETGSVARAGVPELSAPTQRPSSTTPGGSLPSGKEEAVAPVPPLPEGTPGVATDRPEAGLGDDGPSEAVLAWALGALGERPRLDLATQGPYPGCVTALAARSRDDILTTEARGCGRELQDFHAEYILPVYNRKRPYERNLELQEERLRSNHLDPDTLPKYSFVLAEMSRLTGEAWDRFVALDRRLWDDVSACHSRRCRREA